MPEFDREITMSDVLSDAAQDSMRVRIVGSPNTILSEGYVAFIGNGIVAMKKDLTEEPDEFILLSSIIKVQRIGESHMSY